MTKAPNAALVIESARIDETNITIIHHGGDTIVDAFDGSKFNNLELRRNGAVNSTWWLSMNNTGNVSTENFAAGDELEVGFTGDPLISGDSIALIYTPTDDILQRIKVM